MKLSRALSAMAVSAVAALSLCGSAIAANVTVGPSLTSGEWFWEPCGFAACTFVNTNLAGTGPNLTSPVSGAIVRFSVIGGATPGTYRLSTVTPVTENVFGFSKRSVPVTVVPSEEVETYATSLPINAGQTIGLSMSEGASVGFLEHVGGFCRWASEPAESGPAGSHSCFTEVAGFNAEIQPAPMIASLGTTSGPTAGGTSVTISGTDLENATSVSFGSIAAASYIVNSESQITAVAPASASAASVSVTVTVMTIAGKAIASQQFGYVAPPPPPVVTTTPPVAHCKVPNLSGKTLASAKVALAKAKCALGTVKKLAGATAKTGKVSGQGSKAGTQLAAGAKVAVTLKSPKPALKRTKHPKKGGTP